MKSDPLTAVDGICCRIHEFYYIGVIHYGRFQSDPIHLNRPRSDSDPIIVRSLCFINRILLYNVTNHIRECEQSTTVSQHDVLLFKNKQDYHSATSMSDITADEVVKYVDVIGLESVRCSS